MLPYSALRIFRRGEVTKGQRAGSAATLSRPLNRLAGDRFVSPGQKPSKAFMLRSGEVEAIEVHHLVPGRDKVVDELLLGVSTGVDFRQSPELGVRTEDEVDTGACPLERA